jgi:hypothetical protein
MLYGAEVAVCSKIYTKQINTVWAERELNLLVYKTSRLQKLKELIYTCIR